MRTIASAVPSGDRAGVFNGPHGLGHAQIDTGHFVVFVGAVGGAVAAVGEADGVSLSKLTADTRDGPDRVSHRLQGACARTSLLASMTTSARQHRRADHSVRQLICRFCCTAWRLGRSRHSQRPHQPHQVSATEEYDAPLRLVALQVSAVHPGCVDGKGQHHGYSTSGTTISHCGGRHTHRRWLDRRRSARRNADGQCRRPVRRHRGRTRERQSARRVDRRHGDRNGRESRPGSMHKPTAVNRGGHQCVREASAKNGCAAAAATDYGQFAGASDPVLANARSAALSQLQGGHDRPVGLHRPTAATATKPAPGPQARTDGFVGSGPGRLGGPHHGP